MAVVVPFSAITYDFDKAGTPETLCCPPYDIISPREREALVARNPYNMVKLELPVGMDRYKIAGETLKKWLAGGILRRDERECLYVFEEEFVHAGKKLCVNGLVARVKLEEFSEGVILPHEQTLSGAKADRFELMSATGCNLSQIYGLYNDPTGLVEGYIDRVRGQVPRAEFTMPDGVTHRLWSNSDAAAVAEACAAFKGLKLFIADGHHRYETALKFRNELRARGVAEPETDYVMMALVEMSHPGLVVCPTHRLVANIERFEPSQILSGAVSAFEIECVPDPLAVEALLEKTPRSIVYYCGPDSCFLLKLRDADFVKKALPEKSEAYCSLDVTMLHTLLLEPLLGIDEKNMASGRNLSYTRDISDAFGRVNACTSQCAFILSATKVSQIRDVSLAGEKMPQKSTYFYPKLITGTLINKLMEAPL